MLSHKEWEPVVGYLCDRFRVVLPDLPLHGDSEDRPRHPYTIDWFADVLSGFAADVLGPRPLLGGHDAGAEILLHAVATHRLEPARLVVMPNRLHLPQRRPWLRAAWRTVARAGAIPGVDRLLTHGTRVAFPTNLGLRLSARGEPAARDLIRHAFADVPGNSNLARSWAKCAARWPRAAAWQQELLREVYPALRFPVLLLWADRDPLHPLSGAEEALRLLPDGQLRVLEGTGFLMAYDDPVGLARELAAFCG
jgi:pimeloyl-ACP methyl ester carboxylesterase